MGRRLLCVAGEPPSLLGCSLTERSGRARIRRSAWKGCALLAPDREQGRHQDRTEEKADQAEGLEAAENAEQGPQEGQANRSADQSRLHEIVADQHDRGTPSHDGGGREDRPAGQDQRHGGGAEGDPGAQGQHREGGGEDREQGGVRNAGDHEADADENALADGHEDGAVHRAAHGGSHAFRQALARMPEPAVDDRQDVMADLVAAAQQDEEGQEGQECVQQMRIRRPAEGFRPPGHGLAVDAAQKFSRGLRPAQMGLPPGRELIADERQTMDPVGHRQAVLLKVRQPLQRELTLAADLGQREGDRNEEEDGKTGRHEQRRRDARSPEAGLYPAIERPDADGDDHRPAEGDEIGLDHPQRQRQKSAAPTKRVVRRFRALGALSDGGGRGASTRSCIVEESRPAIAPANAGQPGCDRESRSSTSGGTESRSSSAAKGSEKSRPIRSNPMAPMTPPMKKEHSSRTRSRSLPRSARTRSALLLSRFQ